MAIGFGTTGTTPIGVGATSASVDITAATVGDWVYCFVALGINSGAVSATGWTSLLDADEGLAAHYALLRRQKQLGDTTFTFSWTNNTKGTLAWASYSGLDSVTPDEGAALATNGAVSRTAVPTPTATPTAANRWAVGFFGVRTTNPANKPISWTPDANQTERFDGDNSGVSASSPWSGIEIADTNTNVAQSAQSYTANHNIAESHDGSAILFLIPAAVAATGAPLPNTRPRLVLPRRTKQTQHVPVPTQVAPVPPPPPRLQRLRSVLNRRGRIWQPVPPQVVVPPPPFPPTEITSRRKMQRLAPRGKVSQPPWPQVIIPIPFRDAVWHFGHLSLKWVLSVVTNGKWKTGYIESLKWFVGDIDRSKWSFGLPGSRWTIGGVVVPNPDIPLSSLSLEYIRVPVSATANGQAINPTGDTVKMAFLSGASTQPQVSDWKSASWDSVSANGTYFAQCLVGPGGATTLSAGTYYVWIQITDNPEIPVRQVGVIQVV